MGRTGLSTHQPTRLVNFRGQPRHSTSMNLNRLDKYLLLLQSYVAMTWLIIWFLVHQPWESVLHKLHHLFTFSPDITSCPILCRIYDRGSLYSSFLPRPPFLTRSELKGPWHSLTTSQWTSEGMLLIDILKGALVRISSCKSQGDRSLLQQIPTLHEITVWCLGKADISSGLRDIYQVFIPSGGKEVGGRVAWLSDSRVCVYFVLVSCQPLHAGFLRASECLLQHD